MRFCLPLLMFVSLTTAQAAAQGIVAFVQDSCPACRSAEPAMVRLESAGTRVVRYRATGVDPVCRTLGITVTPTFIAVDRHGREVQRIVGAADETTLQSLARRAAAVR